MQSCVGYALRNLLLFRKEREITFTSLFGAQVFSLHCKRRTKDSRPKVAQVISCSFLSLLISTLVFSNSAIANDPSPQRQQQLQNMLKHDCGSCHGLTLKGGLGPSLLPDALKNKTDDFLVQTIQEGRKGTAMPPWKPFMTEQETLWLVRTQLKQ